MKYNKNQNDNKKRRSWGEQIPGNIMIVEENNFYTLIFVKFKEPWQNVFLDLGQMQALLEFIETAETSEEASLGEFISNDELTVRYQDGTYTLHPNKKDIEPTITEEQADAICNLLQHIDTVV